MYRRSMSEAREVGLIICNRRIASGCEIGFRIGSTPHGVDRQREELKKHEARHEGRGWQNELITAAICDEGCSL